MIYSNIYFERYKNFYNTIIIIKNGWKSMTFTIDNWVKGTVMMKLTYLAAIYGIFIPGTPLLYKIAISILLPIGFYYEIKTDHNTIKELMKKSKPPKKQQQKRKSTMCPLHR